MREPHKQRLERPFQAGVAWIDVVVGVAIVAFLASLAATALPGMRESARNRQCQSNLARLGVALHVYHDTHNALPPAAFWVAGQANLARFLKERPVEVTHQNWFQLLLPLLNESRTAGLFRVDRGVTDPQNATGRMARPSIAACPTDGYNRDDNPYVFELSDGSEARFARGNYAINGGTHWYSDAPGWLSCPRPNGAQFVYDAKTRQFQFWGNGIAGFNKSFSFKDFANGLSTLAAIEEVRAGIAPIDPRGVWTLGQIGSSVTWAHGANGDDGGPNCRNAGADDVLHGDVLVQQMGVERLVEMGMPVCDHCIQNIQATSRSLHPRCVNVLFLDGSVRKIGNDIDLGLWHVLHSRDTPSTVLAGLDEAALSGNAEQLPDSRRTDKEPTAAPASDNRGTGTGKLTNSFGMNFQLVPPGEFVMGVPDKDSSSPRPYDAPEHKVRITQGFYLDKCEVTQRQFKAVMGYNPSHHVNSSNDVNRLPLPLPKDTGEFPVENVTWYEADEFCRRLSEMANERASGRRYRLPTEAEWEYACRAGKRGPQAFEPSRIPGDESGITAGKEWIDPPQVPSPVGSFPPNDFGLHDMCGNVHEWCNDWFGKNYYASSPVDDPQGPKQGYLRVIRGWYWIFTGPFCVTNVTAEPWRKSPYVGFRVVCLIPESPARNRLTSRNRQSTTGN
jgi:prepilin-type processing-associated H-X9-DG protein